MAYAIKTCAKKICYILINIISRRYYNINERPNFAQMRNICNRTKTVLINKNFKYFKSNVSRRSSFVLFLSQLIISMIIIIIMIIIYIIAISLIIDSLFTCKNMWVQQKDIRICIKTFDNYVYVHFAYVVRNVKISYQLSK